MDDNKLYYVFNESDKWFVTDKNSVLICVACASKKDAYTLCDFLNKQEEHIENIIEGARESIRETFNEKNKLIHRLWCDSVVPLPVVLGPDECKTVHDDYCEKNNCEEKECVKYLLKH